MLDAGTVDVGALRSNTRFPIDGAASQHGMPKGDGAAARPSRAGYSVIRSEKKGADT